MSEKNIDVVRSIYAAWERGDFTMGEQFDPELEFVAADGAETGTAGLQETAEGVRDFLSRWEDFRLHADEYREVDDTRVLVLDHRSGRAKVSGLDLMQMRTEGARLFDIRDGTVTKLVVYLDRHSALADLGLAE